MSTTGKAKRLTIETIPEMFGAFELPEDLHERYAVIMKLEDIFCELRQNLEKEFVELCRGRGPIE